MNRYEIRVAGHLDPRRADALGCEGLRLLPDGGSRLVFVAADQAAFYGLMTRLRDAGIELVEVRRIGMPAGTVRAGERSDIPSKEVPNVPH
jgi:hypothetical protein